MCLNRHMGRLKTILQGGNLNFPALKQATLPRMLGLSRQTAAAVLQLPNLTFISIPGLEI